MGKKSNKSKKSKKYKKLDITLSESTSICSNQTSALVIALTRGYGDGGLPSMYGKERVLFFLDEEDIVNLALTCKECAKIVVPELQFNDRFFIPKLFKGLTQFGVSFIEPSIEDPDYDLLPYQDEGKSIVWSESESDEEFDQEYDCMEYY